MTDPKQFWEHKILTWEKGRYERKDGGWLESIANSASTSLRFRITQSVECILPYIAGKSILEIGCGTGFLAPVFLQAAVTSYTGIDIADAAIASALQRKAENRWDDRVKFSVDTVSAMPQTTQDVVFSLGLLDWLTDEELDALFKKQGQADFLHAIAESRFSLQQWLHRLYVFVAYGHKTKRYVPRYYTAAFIAQLARKYNSKPLYIYRHPRLSFGAFISSYPIGDRIAL